MLAVSNRALSAKRSEAVGVRGGTAKDQTTETQNERRDQTRPHQTKDLHTQDIRSRRRSVFALSGVASGSADNHRQTSRSKIGVGNKMKHLKIAGLCLAAMFVMSMAISSTASAAGVWEQCSEGGSATKYTEHQCLKAEGSGKWQWNEVKNTEPIRILAMTLTLSDEKTLLGVSTVRCGHPAELEEAVGSVGPGGKGRITVAHVKEPKKECEAVKVCKAGEVNKVAGVDLPWQTELFLTEGKLQTHIEGTGNGEPGWEVECNTIGGDKTDICKQEAGKPETLTLENVKSKNAAGEESLLVLATFLKKFKADCSEGGKESGVVSGQLAILKENGWGLRVS